MQREHIIAVIMLCVTTPREDTIVPVRKVLLGMEKTVQVKFCLISNMRRDFSTIFKLTSRLKLYYFSTVFQISTNVQREHIIAIIMPCVTTPREDTVVPARKVLLGMEKTAQV